MMDRAGEETESRRKRLESVEEEFKPWLHATGVADLDVLWLPVSSFPLRHDERVWLLGFLEALANALKEDSGLREEVFLRFSVASGTLAEPFNRYSTRVQVLPGLTRRPNEPLQGKPDVETVKEEIQQTNAFDMGRWTSDYAVWFQLKRAQEQRDLFFGAGGMSLLFLAPDPATKPPRVPFTPRFRASLPVFQQFNVDELLEGAMALKDGFLKRSKEIFGAGLEAGVDMRTVGFILPSLESRHLVQAEPETRALWFSVFDVYLRESVEDGGILLAFRQEHRPTVQTVLKRLQQSGLHYPAEPVA